MPPRCSRTTFDLLAAERRGGPDRRRRRRERRRAGHVVGVRPGRASTPSTGVRLDGTANGRIYAGGTELAPNVFTAQAWIKTNTTSGGRILGFGDLKTGNSGHRDRHLYMQNDGKLAFGIWAASGMLTIVSPKSYNDNQWHQVTATFGPSGMQLYVDGVRVATRGEITEGQQYLGYWRVGGDNLNNWPSKPIEERLHRHRRRGRDLSRPCSPSSRSTPSGRPAGARRCSRRRRPTPTGRPCTPTSPLLYWRLGEASGTAATDSSASLSPGTYRGTGFTLRPDRRDHAGRPTRRSARPARSGFISSERQLRGPADLLDRDLVQVDVDAGRQADRLREQPDEQLGRPRTGTSTCRTTASSSSASSAAASRRSRRPRPTTTASGTTSSARSRPPASRSTSTAWRSAPTRRRRRRPTPATGGSAATRPGARRAAS